MERNNGRYSYLRRQGQQNQSHNHYSTSSSSSSISSSNSNNNHNYDNHRNNSSSSSSTAPAATTTTSTQFTTANNATYSSQFMSREPITQHDELIRYITEAWTKISEQGTQVYHCNESDQQQLKNFTPFNLGEFWGQRLVQKIRISHGNQ